LRQLPHSFNKVFRNKDRLAVFFVSRLRIIENLNDGDVGRVQRNSLSESKDGDEFMPKEFHVDSSQS
jgi:hypothetical protein